MVFYRDGLAIFEHSEVKNLSLVKRNRDFIRNLPKRRNPWRERTSVEFTDGRFFCWIHLPVATTSGLPHLAEGGI